ncbi:MAG: cysteine--tRNA ligase [Verrucomicrobia bacterium]|nr:cysteine--tRNA ligase [Verrucomicrobiota bacterium]
MKLYLFDTESREKREVSPQDGHTIKMYTCGPTIYDFAHIGNFRTYVFEDLLRRTIQFFGFKVQQAMNITDIDDKTIRGAIAKNIALHEYTEPYRIAFFEDLKALAIQPVEFYPAATEYIPAMIQMIEQLIEKGYAYRSEGGSIYFSIRKFPSYGRLSHLHLDELKLNASGANEADEYQKDNVADFVLWKAYDATRDGKIYWESPFGLGRPGWHIECSAMATQLLGHTIDIHCGGVDNMFPHHENEIAQSECSSGCRFVHQWVHVEHLLVDHKKMSKSLGNFYTLRDLFKKGYSGAEVRYLLLSTHYRTQLNFTFAGLDAARSSLQRIEDFILRLRGIQTSALETHLIPKAETEFKTALADDLNISAALAVLFDLIREANGLIDQSKIGEIEAQKILQMLESWNTVLAVLPLHKNEEIPLHFIQLLEKREEARRAKNWRLSDELRDEILSKGFLIEDTPGGARLKRKP